MNEFANKLIDLLRVSKGVKVLDDTKQADDAELTEARWGRLRKSVHEARTGEIISNDLAIAEMHAFAQELINAKVAV